MRVFVIVLTILLANIATVNAQLVNQETSNGEKEGRWVKHFDNNRVKYEGQFHLNKPYGKFTYYYKSGEIKAVSEFSDDGRVADNVTYYQNGNIMAEGRFINQKKDGIWKYYTEEADNALVSSETYSIGLLNGESITYYPETGKVAESVFFKDGKKDGKLTKYFPDGTLMTESYYKNGLPDGSFVHYHLDGKIQIEGDYAVGVQVGNWKYYDEEGKEVDEEAFKKQDGVGEIPE